MTNIAVQRLYNQSLAGKKFSTAADAVGWFGAVQAQEYALAKWALAMRMPPGTTEDDIERAFAAGEILRTHVMRPTWHFVTPEDIRWILELTAPRVHAFNAYMYRKTELDSAIFARSNDAIINALRGGKQLTREELAAVLAEAGIEAKSVRLGLLMMYAELEGIICSGARRGKQFTYALIDERAPNAKHLPREEALAKLVRQFFTSHGPAMTNEFAWWSGLTQADAKAGLEMNQPHLVKEVINGKDYWYNASLPPVEQTAPDAFLLPPYDEYTIGYRDHSHILESEFLERIKLAVFEGTEMRSGIFGGMTLVNGHLIGSWRRTFSKKSVVIESAPFRPFSADEQGLFEVAAQRFADFLNMPLVLI